MFAVTRSSSVISSIVRSIPFFLWKAGGRRDSEGEKEKLETDDSTLKEYFW